MPLNLEGGRVRVTFAEDGIAWMQPPTAHGEALPATTSAAVVQLREQDVAGANPAGAQPSDRTSP